MEVLQGASTRTKNRIKNHNLVFKRTSNVFFADGLWHFFECEGHCKWVGWLPVEEIQI